jgi:hypothetical protein
MQLWLTKEALDKAKDRSRDLLLAKSQNRSVFVYNYPGSTLHTLLRQDMGEKLLNYETKLLSLARRRFFAVSQALSVATNALLLQLNCAIEGFVDQGTAEAWVAHGMLIVFEGRR